MRGKKDIPHLIKMTSIKKLYKLIAIESFRYEKFKLKEKLKQLKEFRKGKRIIAREVLSDMRKDITRFSKDVNSLFPIKVDRSRSPFENLVFFNDIQSQLNKAPKNQKLLVEFVK